MDSPASAATTEMKVDIVAGTTSPLWPMLELNLSLIQLEKVAAFLGLQLAENDLNSIAASINADRRYAFADNLELRAFYEKNQGHPLMVQFGYDTDALNPESREPGESLRAA